MRGFGAIRARYDRARWLVSGSSFVEAAPLFGILVEVRLLYHPADGWVVSFDRAPDAFWERSRRSRRYGQYAAWHKSCFGSIMLVILVVLLSIFGAGFGAGYGVREAISRRRRRGYRRSMA